MKTSYERATIFLITAGFLFASAAMTSAASTAPTAKAYATPEVAVDDFLGAIRNYDLKALLSIFGSEAERIFVSEDPVADENLRKEFLRLYDEKHEIKPEGDLKRILLVGTDPWPMPVPLVKSMEGWRFDTESGIDEIINRRIGRNELSAIQTCLAAGDAQREYFRRDHDGDDILEYAQTFRSSAGHQDGLYWPAAEGEPESPMGELVATASDEGYGPVDTAFHGYRYRFLTAQGAAAPGGAYNYMVRGNQIGGFAVVAYPASYGDSGVMTFMMSHAGIVYQKDLGENTEAAALSMESFNPEGWAEVDKKDLAIIPDR